MQQSSIEIEAREGGGQTGSLRMPGLLSGGLLSSSGVRN